MVPAVIAPAVVKFKLLALMVPTLSAPAVSGLVPILCAPDTMEPAVIAPAVVRFKLLAAIVPT